MERSVMNGIPNGFHVFDPASIARPHIKERVL